MTTEDRQEPEPCAVKLLKPALFDSNQDVTDFIKEGVVLRKIKHPCAQPGSEFGDTDPELDHAYARRWQHASPCPATVTARLAVPVGICSA